MLAVELTTKELQTISRVLCDQANMIADMPELYEDIGNEQEVLRYTKRLRSLGKRFARLWRFEHWGPGRVALKQALAKMRKIGLRDD